MKTRLKDIAASLGLSVSQVSRALANKNGVAPEIRKAVLAEAGRRGYRNGSGKHRQTVAIIFDDSSPASLASLEKLRKRLKRGKCKILCLFPESICFLNAYRVDKVIALTVCLTMTDNDPSGSHTFQERQGGGLVSGSPH